jgi:cell pole-organizing protein PopZ
MTQPAKDQEPSMEEILASIRRIIADDDPSHSAPASSPTSDEFVAPPVTRPAAPQTAQPSAAAATPLREPTKVEMDAMLAQLREPSRMPDTDELAAAARRDERRIPQPAGFAAIEDRSPRGSQQMPAEPPPANESGLISATTSAQVGSAFNRLAQVVAAPKGPTLEELVSEMLRPMLKAWLDENLPAIVERLVQAEIERVSRRG